MHLTNLLHLDQNLNSLPQPVIELPELSPEDKKIVLFPGR